MPLVEEKNANKFTPEEQAELDAADQELDTPEIEEGDEGQPEPAPQPEQRAAPQQQQADKGRPPPGFVSIAALEEERNWRKQLSADKSRMEQTFQQLVLRQQQPQSPQQPNGQAQPGQIPDFNTDPIGHLQARLDAAERRTQEALSTSQMSRQEQEAYAQMQQTMGQYERHTQDFSRVTPDYPEASQFLRTMREKALSRFMSPAEVDQRIQYEEGLLAGKAMIEGKNPAQLFYELAKDWGYKPKGSDPPENKLERLKNGQRASASLATSKGTGTPAGGTADTMSLETLSELYKTDPVAADRMWDKMAKAGRL